jgi:hypothetical protein
MANLVALTTVNDPGAADAIVEALGQLGIVSQIVPVPDQNPYMRSALQAWQVRVPADRMADARGELQAFEAEVERDLQAQAKGPAIDAADDEADAPATAARRRVSFATLWLVFVVPLPITCLLARAPLAATTFLGMFLGVFVRIMTFGRGGAPIALAWALLGTKIGDLIVGLFITRMRHRAAR